MFQAEEIISINNTTFGNTGKKMVIWNIILLQAFYKHASNPETQWSIPPLMEELKVLTVFFKM